MRVYLIFLAPAGVEEGEGCIETVSLAGRNEVIHIEFICIFSTGAGVKVQFGELYLAGNRERVLAALYSPVNRSSLKEDVLHLINRKVTLILLKLLREGTVQSARDASL